MSNSRAGAIRLVVGAAVVAGLLVALWMGLKDPTPEPGRTADPSKDADDAAIDNAIKESLREYRKKIDKDWEDMFPKDIWPNAKTDRDPGGDDD